MPHPPPLVRRLREDDAAASRDLRLRALQESSVPFLRSYEEEATAAGAAFAAWWTPADVAGPWAWAGHGVGTLVAGGVGYWLGSSVTRTIYELVAEGDAEPGAGAP